MKRASILATACATVLLAGACSDTVDRERDDIGTAPRADGRGGALGRQAEDAQGFIHRAAIANLAEIQLGQLGAERAQHADVKKFGQLMVNDHTKALHELKSAVTARDVQVPTQLDEKHRDIQQRLAGLQGHEFDREFMRVMVETHEDTIDLLEQRAGRSSTRATGSAGSTATDRAATGTDPATGTRPVGGGGQTPSGQAADASVGTSGSATDRNTPASRGYADQMNQQLNEWAARTLPIIRQHLEQAKQIQERLEKTGANRQQR